MPTQPEGLQEAWAMMGYTHAAMKPEYSRYDSNRARSAMAPDTMVHAVAANCAPSQHTQLAFQAQMCTPG